MDSHNGNIEQNGVDRAYIVVIAVCTVLIGNIEYTYNASNLLQILNFDAIQYYHSL